MDPLHRASSGRLPRAYGILAVVLLAGLGLSAVPALFSSPAVVPGEGAPGRRGPLRIGVTPGGNLEAAETVRLTSGVEGRTAILWIAAEGTQVKEGDVVCELDATLLVEKRIEQTIRVGNAEAAQVKANAARAIQLSQNKS